jgi:hypothetical protein
MCVCVCGAAGKRTSSGTRQWHHNICRSTLCPYRLIVLLYPPEFRGNTYPLAYSYSLRCHFVPVY